MPAFGPVNMMLTAQFGKLRAAKFDHLRGFGETVRRKIVAIVCLLQMCRIGWFTRVSGITLGDADAYGVC